MEIEFEGKVPEVGREAIGEFKTVRVHRDMYVNPCLSWENRIEYF
jgi:hypothetical protein